MTTLVFLASLLIVTFLGQIVPLLVILCPLSIIITGFFTKDITNAWAKRIVSWVLPLVACLAMWKFGLNDLFMGLGIGETIAIGVLVGLVNNGVYSIEQIQGLLEAIGAKNKKLK